MPSPVLRIAKVLFILPLACLPASACAAQDAPVRDGRWALLGAGDESRIFLDSSRVEIADGEHTVWLWVDFTEPNTMPHDSTRLYWGAQTHHRLECAEQRVDDLAMRIVDREGEQLDTDPFKGTSWKTFADHPIKNVLSLACVWLTRHRPTGVRAGRAPGAWTEFDRGENIVISVDTSRVTRAGRGVELWLRFDAATPLEARERPGQAYSRMEVRQRVDCGGDSVRSVWMRLYDRSGRLVVDDSTDNPSTISGHPLGQTLYAGICGWLARRQSH